MLTIFVRVESDLMRSKAFTSGRKRIALILFFLWTAKYRFLNENNGK
ncbi:hypothetical protein EC2731150_2531 [Escherichia coli 2731150]|nr:hypothetical protein EC2731150_2531 [Escherichia coli 2731150]